MWNPPWLQSLIPRLRSLRSLLSQSLSLLRPCPRRPRTEPSPAPKRRGRPPGSKNKPKPPKTVPAEEVPAPAPEPATTAAAPAPPAEAPEPAPRAQPEASQPVRMTPAQERALRYMQRQDRYMELLARNTHEL